MIKLVMVDNLFPPLRHSRCETRSRITTAITFSRQRACITLYRWGQSRTHSRSRLLTLGSLHTARGLHSESRAVKLSVKKLVNAIAVSDMM